MARGAVRKEERNEPDTLQNQFDAVANKHWLQTSDPITKVNDASVKKDIWEPIEKSEFSYSLLLQLENLQTLERYLWPGYNEDSSNYHVLLIAFLINVKHRENLAPWAIFEDRADAFTSLFRRFLALALDTTLAISIRTQLLLVIIAAFQSLEKPLVRKECAPLVSVGIWQNLHSEAATGAIVEKNAQFKKAWKTATKRYETGDDAVKAKLRFERAWLYTLLLDFFTAIYDTDKQSKEDLIYYERFIELLCDLQSQFPTRRYVNSLLKDLNTLVLIKLSPLFQEGKAATFRDLWNLLDHYTKFPLDDHAGRQRSLKESMDLQNSALATLQQQALKHFKSKLTLLALSNYRSLQNPEELKTYLKNITDAELKDFISNLGFRTVYPAAVSISIDRTFLLGIACQAYEKCQTFQDVVKEMPTLPTDDLLRDDTFLRNSHYNWVNPLAIPKLNLQYLSTGDFLWRSFILYRYESFFEVKSDVEDTLKRLKPSKDAVRGETRFQGQSRMAVKIMKPAIIEVISSHVGEQAPSQVKAEVILDVSRMNDNLRLEWEALKQDDVVFLVAAEESHPKYLRSAEVLQVMDDHGKPLRFQSAQTNGYRSRPRQRRILLKLDTAAYHNDMNQVAKGKPNIYEHINLIIRRRNRENNFKAVLESIRKLIVSDVPMPSWFQGVFLGMGDPAGASYKTLPQALQSLNFRDTFLDWQHLAESLPDKTVKVDGAAVESLEPPYILTTATEAAVSNHDDAPSKRRRGQDKTDARQNKQTAVSAQSIEKSMASVTNAKSSKKRRREEMEEVAAVDVVKVSTYFPPNMGPYPSDAPKLNSVRFTPAQVEAITSGTQPGLTIIVGPPGTGKTDVATQIINNIYHDFPNERTLLIAHSNQALNQLFQKIVALDIDERHLLRLGHGEGSLQLDTDASFSKHGRVESFMEMRGKLLEEVNRLALSLNAPGAHGNSCETADYFNSVYVKPAWTEYGTRIQLEETSTGELVEAFPFHVFFSNAPQPLFSESASKSEHIEVAQGCYRHIQKLFAELEDIRPFEVLRYARDKANYLLVKEARIIAMTSTHAAIRRQEIADLGFHYDNVIMEEAAQVTEIENYIPMALQNPEDGEMPLKRVVLCGDHLQNSPIIQNLAFRQYANLEQSLFLRLVRLGVPTILLDKQGRARPSLAELYKWRYPQLGNLPVVDTAAEFRQANAGLRYDYQFIDVPDYKGKGEMEPTPHFIQNLGEAEYAVGLYMYMRLLGYPASSISILAMYSGQRALIRDVLTHRCAKNRLFGMPRIVTTVDQYQGEQNDYIILSLTRTSRIGYMRDVRRLTVALSRARLGLYVLGRRSVFEASLDLKEAFKLLFQRPNKLQLVIGEMFPASLRNVDDEVDSTEMDGVEHLGQYVFEMTQAKIANLKAGTETLSVSLNNGDMEQLEDDEDVEGEAAIAQDEESESNAVQEMDADDEPEKVVNGFAES